MTSIHRRTVLTSLCWAAGGVAVSACPVCFQLDDPVMTAAVDTAVLVLGGAVLAVLVPCARFAWRLARRDAALQRAGEAEDA